MALYRNISVVLTANTAGLNTGLRAAAGQIERFNRRATASGLVMKAAGVGALALGAGLAYSVKEAIEFDAAMRNVNSLAHLSESGLKALEKQVIGMSRRLPQSATTLAEGLYDIQSSGFEGADALNVLKASAEAASAGLTTTEVSAKAVSAVINAYGLSAKDATDVSDILFQTVNLGVISFDELASSVGDVVGGAAAAKVSIDQVGSAIAAMTLTGIGGAESVTSLNRLIQAIIDPSEALAGAFKQLGYESGASALETKGLHGVMEDLRKVTGGNIETLLKYFPEIRSARGALALMSNEGRNYNKVAAEIEDKNKRQGATMRTLAEQMKSTKNQAKLLANEINAIAIGVGTATLPYLNKLINGMSLTASEAQDLARVLGRALGPTWDGLGKAIRDVASIAGDAADQVGPLVEILAHLSVGLVVVTLNALATALGAVTGVAADHTTIVLALAAAYGVHLVRGLALAAGGIRLQLWYQSGLAFAALSTRIKAVATSLAAWPASYALATAGIGALTAVGVAAFSAWKDGANDAKEATDAVARAQKAMASGSVQDVVAALDQANKKVVEYDQMMAQVAQRDWIGKVFHFTDGYRILAIGDDMEKVRAKAHQTTVDLMAARTVAIQYLTETGAKFANAADWNKAADNIVNVANKAGVDLTHGLDLARGALDRLDISGQATREALEAGLIEAMGNVGNSAVDAKSAVSALNDALDELMGVQISASQAASDFEESIDAMRSTLEKSIKASKNHRLSLDLDTKAGRDNQKVIRDSVDDLKGRIEAEAKAGKSSTELTTILTKGTTKILDQAEAAGANRKQIEKLIATYGLTPELVQTIVEAVGADSSKGDVEKLQAAIEALTGKKVPVGAEGQNKSAGEVTHLDDRIAALRSKLVRIQQVGADDARTEVERLRAEIARLSGKDITVNATVRLRGGQFGGKAVPIGSANGNIFSYANGGQRLPSDAVIAKDGANLIQWAEPGTGGEAFIPLHPRKRRRSRMLLGEVARRFGGEVAFPTPMASGGVSPALRTGIRDQFSQFVSVDLRAGLAPSSKPVLGESVQSVADTFAKINDIMTKARQERDKTAEALKKANEKVARSSTKATRAAAAQARVDARFAADRYGALLTADKSANSLEKSLLANATQRDKYVADLQAAQDKLTQMQQDAVSYSDQVAAAASDRGSLATLFFGTDGDGNEFMNSIQTVLASMDGITRQTQQFDDVMADLANRGLSPEVLDQIAQLGVTRGTVVANTIAAGGDDVIQQLNAAQAKLAEAADKLGQDSADRMYKVGLATQAGLVAGIRAGRADVEKEMLRTAKLIEASIKKALGIRSPSTVGTAIGLNFASSVAGGQRAGVPLVKRAALEVASAVVPRGMLGGGGVSRPSHGAMTAREVHAVVQSVVAQSAAPAVAPGVLEVRDVDGALIGRMRVEGFRAADRHMRMIQDASAT